MNALLCSARFEFRGDHDAFIIPLPHPSHYTVIPCSAALYHIDYTNSVILWCGAMEHGFHDPKLDLAAVRSS